MNNLPFFYIVIANKPPTTAKKGDQTLPNLIMISNLT